MNYISSFTNLIWGSDLGEKDFLLPDGALLKDKPEEMEFTCTWKCRNNPWKIKFLNHTDFKITYKGDATLHLNGVPVEIDIINISGPEKEKPYLPQPTDSQIFAFVWKITLNYFSL